MSTLALLSEPSWKDILAGATTTPSQISLGISTLRLHAKPYEQFVSLIERALEFAAQDMSRGKNLLQGQTEDQLTHGMLSTLRGMGFRASHDLNVGGHCDITIEEFDDMLWLGEAKIYRSTGNLFGGFRQLVDRYATGLPKQDTGGMIIYVFKQNTLSIMKTWRQRLIAVAKEIISPDPPDDELTFRTDIRHAGSGRYLKIKHLPIVLYHKPTDVLPDPDWKAQSTAQIGLAR